MKHTILLQSEIVPSTITTALVADTMTFTAASDALDLHKNVLARRLAKMVKAGLASSDLLSIKTVKSFYDAMSDVITPDTATGAPEIVKLRRRLSDAEYRARSAEEALRDQSAMSDILAGIAATTPNPPDWTTDWIPHLGKTESIPALIHTDWHLGEVVHPLQTGGYAYNVAIASERIERTVKKAIEMTRISHSDLKYPGCIVALGGDMTSGALHPELAESDELSVQKSILVARDLIIAAIKTMADEFGRVYVPTAVGNHGRIFDKKPRAKGYVERNSDWQLYNWIAFAFRDDPRVTVSNNDSGESIFSIYGTKFLLTHGDCIGAKGGDGIIGSIGPIMRGTMKTMKSLASLGHDIDHIIVGHYHQTITLKDVTVCGSLKGPDEYAMRLLRAKADDPSQMLMIIHPEHGITFRSEIFLTDKHCPIKTKAAREKSWVSVFQPAD